MADVAKERHFRFIKHCNIGDESLSPYISKARANVFRNFVGKEDSLGFPIAEDNIIEIPAEQLRILANHLPIDHRRKSNLINSVKHILKQICDILITGSVHPLVSVREIQCSRSSTRASRNQYGCFANGNIAGSTVLLQFLGDMRAIETNIFPELNEQQKDDSLVMDWAGMQSPAISEASDSFSVVTASEKHFLLDARHMGNESSFINEGGKQSNAFYMQVYVNGWPCIFCVTSEEIKTDEQILTEYDEMLWERRNAGANTSSNWRVLREPPKARIFCQDGNRQAWDTEPTILDSLPSALELLLHDELHDCALAFSVENFVRTRKSLRSTPDYPGPIPLLPRFESSESEDGGQDEPQSKRRRPAYDNAGAPEHPRRADSDPGFGRVGDSGYSSATSTAGGSRVPATAQRLPPPRPAPPPPPAAAAAATTTAAPVEVAAGMEEVDVRRMLEGIRIDPAAAAEDPRGELRAFADRLARFVELCFRAELAEGRPGPARLALQLARCRDGLDAAEPCASVVVLGDTGVGKSFLLNLLLLLTAPTERAYGFRKRIRDAARRRRDPKRPARGGGPGADPEAETGIAMGVLGEQLHRLPGIAEACRRLRPERRAEALADALRQLGGAPARSELVVQVRREPLVASAAREEAEGLLRLLRACERVATGDKFEFLLRSRSEGTPTTGHVIRLRHGPIYHAVVPFAGEEELRAMLGGFDWERNAGGGDGDERLLDAMRRRLRLFEAPAAPGWGGGGNGGEPLEEWPGEEAFAAARPRAAALRYMGKVVVVCGSGSSLRDDRVHVREGLRRLLHGEEGGDEEGGDGWAASLLAAEAAVYGPSDLLEGGLELVDAPGTNDDDPVRHAAARAAVRGADAVLALLGSEVPASVLEALEACGALGEMLAPGAGAERPVGLLHTCGESRGNLLSNEGLLGRAGAGARAALQRAAEGSLARLEDRLRRAHRRLPPEARAAAGEEAAAAARAARAARGLTRSCLPLLWASNLAHPDPAFHASDAAQKAGGGGAAFELLLRLSGGLSGGGSRPGPVGRAAAELHAACDPAGMPREGGAAGGGRPSRGAAGLYGEVAGLLGGRVDKAVESSMVGELDRMVCRRGRGWRGGRWGAVTGDLGGRETAKGRGGREDGG